MQLISEFIARYAEEDRPRIAFAWNGKHAADFVDANQDFRWQVISLAPELLAHLIRATREAIDAAEDSPQRKALEAALELFSKIQAGNAGKGWISLNDNSKLSDISIVWPRWYHKAWGKLASLWRRHARR